MGVETEERHKVYAARHMDEHALTHVQPMTKYTQICTHGHELHEDV